MTGMHKHVNIISLGCSKNLVDSERLARQLELNGYLVDFEGNNLKYDATIINTCGFIHDAKEESIETILNAINGNPDKNNGNVIVFGCLTELYQNELKQEIPEVEFWKGKFDYMEILKFLNAKQNNSLFYQRSSSTPSHYAYLKISEGCNRKCAFCSIPAITGKHKSVPVENLVKEAEYLASNGVKELILIAQDLNSYGKDLQNKVNLTNLISELSKIEPIEWIRLHYAYPENFPDGLIDEIKNNPKVCKYLDIPFQHAADSILRNMQRGHSEKTNSNIIQNLRGQIPDISLRTTLMVGFPGETDEDFNKLIQFVNESKFDKMGAFTYSHEEFTTAIKKYHDNIPQETKQQRLEKLMEIQYDISASLLSQKVGQELKVIIDRKENNTYIARSQYESPDVDGEIRIENAPELNIGSFYIVCITESDAYDLFAKIVHYD
jgi:ribosomal protein S12 methylthiotransferase